MDKLKELLPNMEKWQCKKTLFDLNLKQLQRALEQKTARVDKTDFTAKVLQTFVERKWIQKYQEDKDGLRYKVIGNEMGKNNILKSASIS